MDELLTSGGMSGMLPTVWLIFAAMVFGGVMEAGGFLARITAALLSRVRGDGSLIAATAGTCVVTNVTASDQYLAIALPGRMFVKAFAERGLASQNLSRTLEDAGTVTSVLVPWNTCGAYHAGVLGVATLAYAPFAFFLRAEPVHDDAVRVRGDPSRARSMSSSVSCRASAETLETAPLPSRRH